MSTSQLHPTAKQSRDIAWIRIKLIVGWVFRVLSLTFGSILVLIGGLGLFGALIALVVGKLEVGPLKFGTVALNLDGYQIDCTTWWGASILLLFNLFLLVWGWDFVKGGRSNRPISPSGRAHRALAVLRLKLLFDTLLRRTKH